MRVFRSQGVCGDLPLEGGIFSLGVILIPFPLCTWGRDTGRSSSKRDNDQKQSIKNKNNNRETWTVATLSSERQIKLEEIKRFLYKKYSNESRLQSSTAQY